MILTRANNFDRVASAEALANALLALDTPLETPFLLMERNKILEQIERWNRYLPFVSIHYAVKANSDPLLIQLLAENGCNFDVASASEMELVSKLNVSGNRMVLSHPAKTGRTLRAMAVIQPWAFAVDTTTEVDRVVAQGLPSETYDPVLFVRLKTQSKSIQDDLSAKFGCAADRALSILKHAKSLGWRRFGLSFHVGTQCCDPSDYRRALMLVQQVAQEARKTDVQVHWIDIGGGFSDAQIAHDRGSNHDELFRSLAVMIEPLRNQFTFISEPGRYLVADAGHVVVEVISVDWQNHGQPQILIDDHIYGALCGAKFDSRIYDFIPLDARHSEEPMQEADFTIFGGTCDSVDCFEGPNGATHRLPVGLQVGDKLIVHRMGAYSSSSGSSFNGLPPASVVLAWSERGEVSYTRSGASSPEQVATHRLQPTKD